jgi:hypothetical protein
MAPKRLAACSLSAMANSSKREPSVARDVPSDVGNLTLGPVIRLERIDRPDRRTVLVLLDATTAARTAEAIAARPGRRP